MNGNYNLQKYGKVELKSNQEADAIDDGFGLTMCADFSGAAVIPAVLIGKSLYDQGLPSFTGWLGKQWNIGNPTDGLLDHVVDGALYSQLGVFALGATLSYLIHRRR